MGIVARGSVRDFGSSEVGDEIGVLAASVDGSEVQHGVSQIEDESQFSQLPPVDILRGWNCGREFRKVVAWFLLMC